MKPVLPVSDVRFVAASERDRASGMLGYIRLHLGEFVVDGITLRKTADRRLTLSFPSRTDRHGERHPLLRPANDTARREFEARVLEALGLGERQP